MLAIYMQVVLGVLYSWSVFRGPLSELYGWSQAQTIAPYSYSLLVLAVGMIVAGFLLDRKGPRVVATIGGFLLGTGFLLAALFGDSIAGLIFSYGILAGMGVGFAYVAPIANCLKWFPDKRGTIVGLAVMGSGLGPLVYGPLLEIIIGNDPAQFSTTIPRTFMILAVVFYVAVIGAAQLYKEPPPGWKPAGWTPAPGRTATRDFSTSQMLGCWQFYALWLLYFLGSSVGLTALGEAAPQIESVTSAGVALSGGVALGIMGVFNGVGRLSWGAFSDRFGRKLTVILMSMVSAIACLGFLRQVSGFWPVLVGLCLAAFTYGGYLALMPSLSADYFGAKNVGANYGLLFTAWGICGFVVPGYFAGILDRARITEDLAAGYNTVYLQLAVLAVIGAVIAVFLHPPRKAHGSR